MNLGVRLAFEEANREGGVHGRLLKLLLRDDGYEPEAAIANTRELIAHGIFALIGAVGTPTSSRAAPIAEAARVPYIGAFTGPNCSGARSSAMWSTYVLRTTRRPIRWWSV